MKNRFVKIMGSSFLLLTFLSLNVFSETRMVSFQLYSLPDHYIGVETDEAHLYIPENEINKEITSFNLVPGLADKRSISFQSALDPQYYLRHENSIIKLHKFSSEEIFLLDATFKKVPGLVDTHNPKIISFESYNYPGCYIRHREGTLYIDPNDESEIFKNGATFIITPSNWNGEIRLTKPREMELHGLLNPKEITGWICIFYIGLIIIIVNIILMKARKKKRVSRGLDLPILPKNNVSPSIENGE